MIDSHSLLEDDTCSYDNEKREATLLNVADEPNELPSLALVPSKKMKLYCRCRSLGIRCIQTTAASVAAGLGGYSSP